MTHDPTWLDAQYNNRALVPDFANYFARWQAESADARAALNCALDLPYAPEDAELGKIGATLDVFRAAKPNSPILFFVHGGYWRGLDKADHSFIARAFAPDTCVVIPNYALCPGKAEHPVTIPLICRQMAAAYAWTVRNAAQFGGDPSRITVIGHSAGGHLAAMLMALQTKALGLQAKHAVRRAVAISGLFDLEVIRHVPFLANDLRLTELDALRCSPAFMPAPKQGKLICVAGADESAEFRRHNQLMQQAWGKARVPDAYAEPACNHFSVLDALCKPQTRLHRAVCAQLG
jgi:arylformamidase